MFIEDCKGGRRPRACRTAIGCGNSLSRPRCRSSAQRRSAPASSTGVSAPPRPKTHSSGYPIHPWRYNHLGCIMGPSARADTCHDIPDTVTVGVPLGTHLLRRLDAVASDLGMDRPEAIHTALLHWLEKEERKTAVRKPHAQGAGVAEDRRAHRVRTPTDSRLRPASLSSTIRAGRRPDHVSDSPVPTRPATGDDFPRLIVVTLQHPTPFFDDSYHRHNRRLRHPRPCPSRIRCQAATGSWTKSRQWET